MDNISGGKMKEFEKEKIKITANYLNGIAIATFAVFNLGFLVGEISGRPVDNSYYWTFGTISVVLHIIARWYVGQIKNENDE